jgi:transposase-like protein
VRETAAPENGGMRSKEEIRGIVEGFAKSGMTRREYCEKHNLAITTLDYWRSKHQKQKPRLVEVAVEAPQPPAGFALVLPNGRRIESPWSFAEADLARVIRVVEG